MNAVDAIYHAVAKPFFFRLDAELAHRLTLKMLSMAPPLARPADPPELAVKLWGIEFANPVGLAAGMDKDAIATHGWEAMGFGFAEMGTVTPRPQPGNERPRLWRLHEHRALINRLGFPGEGMDAVAERLQRLRARGAAIRLAVNFGPNKDTAPEAVAADYAALMNRLGRFADFVVVNVSSPNTPGLRNWQSPERMRDIFAAIRASQGDASRRPPVLVKLSPDLERDDLHRICDTVLELGIDGIVACNTTIAREALGVMSPHPGGLSGRQLLERAREVIGDVYTHTGGRIPIIGVGGIASAEDAWGHIRAGASMVELYTALVYEGPGVVGRIKAGLCDLLRRGGFRSISEAVGTSR